MTKSQIVLTRPIKAIGVHEVKVVLHPEVATTVKVNVARSPEEADLQAQGVDVMAQMFERDTASFTEDVVPGSAADGDAPIGEAPVEAAADAPAEATADGRGRGQGRVTARCFVRPETGVAGHAPAAPFSCAKRFVANPSRPRNAAAQQRV